MTSLQTVPQQPLPKKQVKFCPGTKTHDGLSPLSTLVEEPLVYVFNTQIPNKTEFVRLVRDIVAHHKLDVEAALQHVHSSLNDMIQRLSMSKRDNSKKGSPILLYGGGKGYFLPSSAIATLKTIRLWVAGIDVQAQFAVELSV